MDPRDFGPNGKIDRMIYTVSVRAEDRPQVMALLEGLDDLKME